MHSSVLRYSVVQPSRAICNIRGESLLFRHLEKPTDDFEEDQQARQEKV
jgi:hypothetical protein